MNQAAKYLSAEERRGMAVKAVLELAAVQNPGDITTTAIAARMGLSQGAALEAMFMTHIAFAVEYPGIPRMLFGELQKTESTPAKIVVASLLEGYGQLLAGKLEQGKACGEVDGAISTDVAVSLFVGAVQGLVIKALLLGDMACMTRGAVQTFALFRRAVRGAV